MRMALMVIAAAAALMAGTAQANPDRDATAAGKDAVSREGAAPATKKVLQVCDEDTAALGSSSGLPPFVTAKQVRAAEGKAWSGPKCITPSELRRLTGSAPLGPELSALTRPAR